MNETSEHRVVVTREGWDGTVDELAELLATRFHRPAFRLRVSLQRGEAEVLCTNDSDEALRVAGELGELGIGVRVESPSAQAPSFESPAPGERPISGRTIVARTGRTFLSGAGQGTLLGLPSAGLMGRTFQGTPVRLVEALDADAARAPVPRPSLPEHLFEGVSQDNPPLDAAPTAKAETSTHASGRGEVTQTPAAANASDGWGAVLGSGYRPPAAAAAAPPAEPPRAQPTPPDAEPRLDATLMLGAEAPDLQRRAAPPEEARSDVSAPSGSDRSEIPSPFASNDFLDGSPGAPARPRAYRRLERPAVSQRSAEASPRRAVWSAALSLAAPGAGQVFNGDSARGMTFAVSGWLILPWLWSIVDAWRAGLQADESVPRRWTSSLRLVVGFWAVVLLFGTALLALRSASLRDAPRIDSPPIVFAAPPPADTEQTAQAREAAAEEQLRLWEDARRLAREAAIACADQRWETCMQRAEAALEADPSNREALRLQVQASLALRTIEGSDDHGAVQYEEPQAPRMDPRH